MAITEIKSTKLRRIELLAAYWGLGSYSAPSPGAAPELRLAAIHAKWSSASLLSMTFFINSENCNATLLRSALGTGHTCTLLPIACSHVWLAQ